MLVCMEEHEVNMMEVIDTEIFNNEEVSFAAICEYCYIADEYLETQEMIKKNSMAMKAAYRKKGRVIDSNPSSILIYLT